MTINIDLTGGLLDGEDNVPTAEKLRLLLTLLLIRRADGRFHATPEIAQTVENWLNLHRLHPVRIICVEGRLKALHCDIVVSRPRKPRGKWK